LSNANSLQTDFYAINQETDRVYSPVPGIRTGQEVDSGSVELGVE